MSDKFDNSTHTSFAKIYCSATRAVSEGHIEMCQEDAMKAQFMLLGFVLFFIVYFNFFISIRIDRLLVVMHQLIVVD